MGFLIPEYSGIRPYRFTPVFTGLKPDENNKFYEGDETHEEYKENHRSVSGSGHDGRRVRGLRQR
jgi:hypothetical protein